MSRSEHRGASYLAQGEDVIAAAQDRRASTARPPGNAYIEVERDWSTPDGAKELKRRIEAWWREEFGVAVTCRVEPTGYGTYGVRSGLRAGLPTPGDH